MKVIGVNGSRKAICEVDHTELAKFLGLYYGKGNLGGFEVGQVIDLGKGHDHRSEIVSALEKTKKFIEGSESIIKAITDGILIVTPTENRNEDNQS